MARKSTTPTVATGPDANAAHAGDIGELLSRLESSGRENGRCHPLTLESAAALGIAVAGTMAGSGRERLSEAASAAASQFPPSPETFPEPPRLWRHDSFAALCRLAESARRRDDAQEPRESVLADGATAAELGSGAGSVGYVGRTLRRLAHELDHAGRLKSGLGCYRMAFGCIRNPSGKGERPCPIPDRHWHEHTDLEWDNWRHEAKSVFAGILHDLRAGYGEGHVNVLEAERLRDFVLRCDGEFGEPDPESLARFTVEFRRHLERELDEASRMLAISRSKSAFFACERVMIATFMDPRPYSDLQVRACALAGRWYFTDSHPVAAYQNFECACEISEEAGVGRDNPDVLAAEVGLVLSKQALDRSGMAVPSFSKSEPSFRLNDLERRLGPFNEFTLKAKAIRGCRLPQLTVR
ncbi:MAG: hypothetical protein LBQ12_03925 [Deltaproteobacteria bacterium]|jgi:hypothetical protein|nr:hypothetical protein [Deltaproteobacteria bacterium]